MRRRHREQAADLIGFIASRAEALLGWRLPEQKKTWLIEFCARQLVSYPLRRREAERWLRAVRPRFLFVEEGCYGHMGVVNATAREHGVAVAEFQHGTVTRGHTAYNVAPTLARSAQFQNMLPHYFLSYGGWWNKQLNLPVNKVTIGNPHREELVQGLERLERLGPKRILILGDGIETELYLELCGKLAGLLSDDFRVVFRPHPLERSKLTRMVEESAVGSHIEVDWGADIYTALLQSYAVVAEVSTGLFEAIGLVERVLVWQTEKSRFSLPDHPFFGFSGATELADALADPSAGVIAEASLHDVWASGWRTRFDRFYKEALSGSTPARVESICG